MRRRIARRAAVVLRAQDQAAFIRAALAAGAGIAGDVARAASARRITQQVSRADERAALIGASGVARVASAKDIAGRVPAGPVAVVLRIADHIAIRARTSRFANADAAAAITPAKWVAEAAGESVAGHGRLFALRLHGDACNRIRAGDFGRRHAHNGYCEKDQKHALTPLRQRITSVHRYARRSLQIA